MARRIVSLGLGLAIELCAVGSAAAHGRPPEVTQITMRDGRDTVVATTRGLLFGDPSTHRWSLLCSAAFGVATGVPYRVAQLPGGRLYVANVRGVRVSDDGGCSWRPHSLLGELDVTYLFQDTTRPERLYVSVFGADGGGIHVSEDGGETFRVLYHADPGEFLNSIEAAQGDPRQLYATLSTTEELPRMFVLRSSDAGATWSRTELSDAEEIIDVTLLAVNPADAGELLLRVRYADSWAGDGLLWSRDGGRSFSLLGHFGRVSDVTFSRDGTTTFLVASGGLMRASTPERRFGPMDAPAELSYGYGSLFDRKLLVSGYRAIDSRLQVDVWSTDVDNGSTRERWLSFEEVSSAKSCPLPSQVNAQCALDWLDWSNEFLPKPSAPTP